MIKHRPHKAHNFEGTPNPVLSPIKRYIRAQGGKWPARAWRMPSARPPPPTPALRVFALWHGDRRFIVRAMSEDSARQILDHQLA
jgi:hypothetical protein